MSVPAFITLFRCDRHPLVKTGLLTRDQVLDEFLSTFDVLGTDIQWNDFKRYYTIVSFCTNRDQDFFSMMDSCWSFECGDEEQRIIQSQNKSKDIKSFSGSYHCSLKHKLQDWRYSTLEGDIQEATEKKVANYYLRSKPDLLCDIEDNAKPKAANLRYLSPTFRTSFEFG